MYQSATVIRETFSLCPECSSETIAAIENGDLTAAALRDHRGVVDAQVVEADGQIFMRKHCAQHGDFEDLLASDATFYKRIERLSVPAMLEDRPNEPIHDHGVMSVRYGTGTFMIIDLTNRCNMRCQPCFMDANAGQDVHELSMNDIKAILDRATSVEKRREVNILFSGGEPTISPRFLEAVRYAHQLGFKRLHVATNGIRFAQDEDFASRAKDAGLHGVFLQLDGVTDEKNAHRGISNFMAVKVTALENITAAGLQVTLQSTLVNQLNVDQVGPIVEFAVERGIFGIIFQPIMFTGRDRGISTDLLQKRRYTLSHLVGDLGGQVNWDWQPLRDWFPVNTFGQFGRLADRLRGTGTSMVCTTGCNAGVFSALLVNTKTKTTVPVTRCFDLEGFLGDLRNICDRDFRGLALMEALQTAIDSRFIAEAAPEGFDRANLYQLLEQCIARVNSSVEGWDERAYENTEWRLFIVNGMWFQDLFNFDLRSIEASTTVVATQDGEISFCAYNSGGWREAVERIHRTAPLADWHHQHGRHHIYANGQLVQLEPTSTPAAVPEVTARA